MVSIVGFPHPGVRRRTCIDSDALSPETLHLGRLARVKLLRSRRPGNTSLTVKAVSAHDTHHSAIVALDNHPDGSTFMARWFRLVISASWLAHDSRVRVAFQCSIGLNRQPSGPTGTTIHPGSFGLQLQKSKCGQSPGADERGSYQLCRDTHIGLEPQSVDRASLELGGSK